MGFKFGLEKVREHRKILEDIAQREMQEMMALLVQQTSILDGFIDQVEKAQHRRHELAKEGGRQVEALQKIHEFLKGQDIRIKNHRQKMVEIENLVEAKREILRHAAIEYKIIDKLKEKKFEEYKTERRLLEVKEMDEQSVMRFQLRGKLDE